MGFTPFSLGRGRARAQEAGEPARARTASAPQWRLVLRRFRDGEAVTAAAEDQAAT
jgi:hypothetical protein